MGSVRTCSHLPKCACGQAEGLRRRRLRLLQAQNWCQAACLNASRTRRRLRRLLEDWNNLGGHAALADAAPGVVAALEGAGWRWQGLGAEDPQARRCTASRCAT